MGSALIWKDHLAVAHLTRKDTSKSNCVLHFPSQLFFLFKCIFNWRIIALQCYIGFCHTTMWISHKHTYVHSLLNLFSPPHLPSDCHRPPGWAPTQLAQLPTSCFTHGRVYMPVILSQFIPPSFSHYVHRVHSLRLCLCFCPANRFISTIFLDSIYMH